MRRLPFLLALFVLLAGCSAPVLPGDGPTTAESTPTAVGTTATPAPSTGATSETTDSSSTPQSTATPAAGVGPWGADPVVVAVEGPDDGRDYAALVREATEYWEHNDGRYLGYEIDYEVVSDAEDPDVVVAFQDTIPDCGGQEDAVGCAPYITDERQIDRPVEVFVKTGFGDDSTVEIVEHELGHTLGLNHGDEPLDLMNATGILYTLPRTDATEKDFPWDDPNFTVYVDTEGANDPDGAREQIQHALDYYAAGAPGMPDNLTFTFVDSAEEADISVLFAEESPCGEGAASCAAVSGYDPDGDGALETYDHFRVVLVNLDTDAVGWHLGYWMAHYFGAEDDADKPDPFRDATYAERRSEWWE